MNRRRVTLPATAQYDHVHAPGQRYHDEHCLRRTDEPPEPSSAPQPAVLRRTKSASSAEDARERRAFISFETNVRPIEPGSPVSLRRLPSFSIRLDRDGDEADDTDSDTTEPSHHELSKGKSCGHRRCHSVCLVMQRGSHVHASHIVTHVLSVDVRLLQVLVFLSMLFSATGLVLGPSTGVGRAHGGLAAGRAATSASRTPPVAMDLEDSAFADLWSSEAAWGAPAMEAAVPAVRRVSGGSGARSSTGRRGVAPGVSRTATTTATAPAPAPAPASKETGSASGWATPQTLAAVFARASASGVTEPKLWPVGAVADAVVSTRARTVADAAEGDTEPPLEAAAMADGRTAPHHAPRRLYTAGELEAALSSSREKGLSTVVLFGSKACRTCRLLQPKMEALAARAHAGFLFVQHDRTTKDLFATHGVTQTPTLHVYTGDGTLVDSAVYASSDLPRLSSVLERV